MRMMSEIMFVVPMYTIFATELNKYTPLPLVLVGERRREALPSVRTPIGPTSRVLNYDCTSALHLGVGQGQRSGSERHQSINGSQCT